jgi:hypothetical protein
LSASKTAKAHVVLLFNFIICFFDCYLKAVARVRNNFIPKVTPSISVFIDAKI